MFVSALLLASIVLYVSGCGKKAEQNDGRITVVFWHSFVATTIPSLNELIQKFEDGHPKIRIKAQYVPTGDALVQKLVTAIKSGTTPDIAWIHADFLDKLVEANAIYRMDEFVHGPDSLTTEDLADIFPPLLQAAKWRDTLYAIPMEATSLGLLYNKSVFRQSGLDPDRPPKDWKELRQYARRLTVDADGDGKTDRFGFYVPVYPASGELNIWMTLQWMPFLWQAGGREINEAQTEVYFNSKAGVGALTLWKDLYEDLDFAKFGLTHDVAFASQKVAMAMDGPWDLPRYRAIRDFEWGVAPLPAGPVRRATYIAGEHIAIFRNTPCPRESWTFVKWVIQPEVQAFFSMRSGYLPIRRSVLSMKEYQEFLATDLALKAFVDQMKFSYGRHPIDHHRVEINRALAEAIERSIVGKIDPQTALDEAVRKSNELLKSKIRTLNSDRISLSNSLASCSFLFRSI